MLLPLWPMQDAHGRIAVRILPTYQQKRTDFCVRGGDYNALVVLAGLLQNPVIIFPVVALDGGLMPRLLRIRIPK